MATLERPPLQPDRSAWTALHQNGAVVAHLESVGGLRVTGSDRVDFLNGQLAHDVRALPEGGVQRALYLDVKGHALDEMRVHRRERDLYLAVEDGNAEPVLRRLLAHRVFDDVEIDDLSDSLACVTVQGPDTSAIVHAALGATPPDHDGVFSTVRFRGADVLSTRHRRTVPGGLDLHLLRRDLPDLLDAVRRAGALDTDVATLEASRIEAGIARAAADAGPGILPQESGLTEAVSTRKGCYLGQETMARIEARAHLRRDLRRLCLATIPIAGAPRTVTADGRDVGRLGTFAPHPTLGVVALSVLRTDVPEDAVLEAAGVPAAILIS